MNNNNRFSYFDDKNVPSIKPSSIRTVETGRRETGASVVAKESRMSVWSKDDKPRVKDLKSFYDNLTERSEEDMMMMERQRTGSIKMNESMFTFWLAA